MRFLLAALLVMAVLPARAGQILDAIHKSGTLRVGMTGDYKPFDSRAPDGTYQGADVEMAKSLAKTLGVKLQIVPTSWPTLMADYQARKFDIAMGGISILPAREAVGPFTPALRTDGKRPITRCADKDKYITIAAINQPGVRVIVNPGASNEAFAKKNFPKAKLTVYPDNTTIFDQIIKGRADVMVTDGIEVDHQALIHHELCAADVKAPFTHSEQGYWVEPDAELLAAVDHWVDQEQASGDYDRVLAAAQKTP